jgi:DnaK suppressor protein
MSARNHDHYRRRLEELRTRMEGNVASLTAQALQPAGGEQSGGISNAPLHLADLGTHTQDQDVALGLLQNERQELRDIDAALERLEEGRYGLCNACGQAIPPGRLEAMPQASRCVPCAEKQERSMEEDEEG